MIDTKQKAKYILEDYANCYSQVDLEQLAKYLDEIKAEAMTEFVKELKETFGYYDWENKVMVYPEEEIDNLLKEMVGEDNVNTNE